MTDVPASMPAAPATVPAAAGPARTFTIELPAGLPLLNEPGQSWPDFGEVQ